MKTLGWGGLKEKKCGPSGANSPPQIPTNSAEEPNILNLTTGTSLLLGERTTVATGFAFPLRDGFDKLFDWELNVQLNYYR